MIGFAFALLFLSPPDCSYDRAALLALDQQAFDQDLSGGWRALAAKGCEREAADAIRDWRTAHKAESKILFWHEGQMRALAGDADGAAALFQRSKARPEDDPDGAWAPYADGSIAFVRGDRVGLEAARARLAALPKPADWEDVALDAQGKPFLNPDGSVWRVPWPMNLDVLDRLLRCWGQTYKQAYSCPRPKTPEKQE